MAYVPNLQIQAGGFTDFEGNPLNAGYLLMQLSHDECYAVGPNQVVGGLKIQVNLNSTGNIPTSPATLVWSNDVLTPSGSYYIVRAFKSDGTEAWASPQYWTLAASPDPLDVGTIVPTNPPGSGLGGGGTTLLLETNGTVNTNQALLNIAQGTNVTITNSSGTTTINASGTPTFSTSGFGYFTGPGFIPPFPFYGSSLGTGVVNNTSTTNQLSVWQFIFLASIVISRVSVKIGTGVAAQTVNFGIYSQAGNKLLDSGAMAAATSSTISSVTITPVTISPGIYWFAQSTTHLSVNIGVINGVTASFTDFLNTNGTYVGTAANITSGGVMPATLGAITGSDLNSTNPGAVIFQV